MTFPTGKIPADVLKRVVFRNLGALRKEVAIGPTPGIDAAVIDVGNKSLIVSMDPITGATERIGRLAVHVNANDIATFGVEPAFMLACFLLPEGTDTEVIADISRQLSRAAKELNVAIVGGHCEITPGICRPIVVGAMMGITDKGRYVTAGGAKAGDSLILTKWAGIEGTAILALDRENELKKTLKTNIVAQARRLYEQISIVQDALTAFRTGSVHAMHDPTEGGIFGGIHEMADASRLGVEVLRNEIRMKPETNAICRYFEIDPFQLVSSGALLIAAGTDDSHRILEKLKDRDIEASVIGQFLEGQRMRSLVEKNGKKGPLPRPVSDHIWKALAK